MDFDLDDPDFVSVMDELPLWSAPFGLTLLDTVKLRGGINALDIGCGMGFPLVELAQRLGPTCRVYGIDPWEAALGRIRTKLTQLGVTNVEVVRGLAEHMPFENGFFDLIVSNNGINNVEDPAAVMRECFRVCRPGAQLIFTLNLPDTMKEFYELFQQTLMENGLGDLRDAVREQIFSKRKPLPWTKDLILQSGFTIVSSTEDAFQLRYLNGTAMFSHSFIRLAFLKSWKDIVPSEQAGELFEILRTKLDDLARETGELSLTIPFVCIDCKKP